MRAVLVLLLVLAVALVRPVAGLYVLVQEGHQRCFLQEGESGLRGWGVVSLSHDLLCLPPPTPPDSAHSRFPITVNISTSD